MNHKLLRAGAGSFLLLAVSLAPSVLGHDDNGSRSGDVDAGVSGTYYGTAGFFVALSNKLDDPNVSNDFFFFEPTMVCDLEVLGDGTSEQEPDETEVDSWPVGVGTVPDGTWNDGGFGGGCHTNHYDHSRYNTPGCLDDGVRASSVLGLPYPWVGASCDWKGVEGGTPRQDILKGCLVQGIRDGIDDQPTEAAGCIFDFIQCTANPISCAVDGIESCGADGTADATNYGIGSTRTAYPYSTSFYGYDHSYLGDGLGCIVGDAVAMVFVFTGVQLVQDNTDVPVFRVNPAIAGSIWQVA